MSNSIKRIHEIICLAGAGAGFLHASGNVSHKTLLSGDIEAPVICASAVSIQGGATLPFEHVPATPGWRPSGGTFGTPDFCKNGTS